MNLYKLLLLLVLVLGINVCNNLSIRTQQQNLCCIQSECKYAEKSCATFSDLVQNAYFLRNDNVFFPDLCRLLNDSILSCKKKTWLCTSSKFDSTSQCVFWELIHVEPMLERTKDRFSYRVCITMENEIFMNNNNEPQYMYCINDISTIKQQAIEFLFYPEEKDKYLIIKKHDIEMIGEIEVAHTWVEFSRDVENGLNINEWKLFFDCMHELILAYEEERNKKSVEIWGVEYHHLSCDKMKVMTNIVDYKIFIDFFRLMPSHCNPPPPPPTT